MTDPLVSKEEIEAMFIHLCNEICPFAETLAQRNNIHEALVAIIMVDIGINALIKEGFPKEEVKAWVDLGFQMAELSLLENPEVSDAPGRE